MHALFLDSPHNSTIARSASTSKKPGITRKESSFGIQSPSSRPASWAPDTTLIAAKDNGPDYMALVHKLSDDEVAEEYSQKTAQLRSSLTHGIAAPLADHHATQRNLQDKAYFDHALGVAEAEHNPQMLKRLIQAVPFLPHDAQRAAYDSTDKALQAHSDPDLHAFAQVYRAAAERSPKLKSDIKMKHDLLYSAGPMHHLVLLRDPETDGLRLSEIAQTQKGINLDSDIGQAFWSHLNTNDHALAELAVKNNDPRLLSHERADFRVIVHFLNRLEEVQPEEARVLRAQIADCPGMNRSMLPLLLVTTEDHSEIEALTNRRQYPNDSPL